MLQKVTLADALGCISDPWSPKIAGDVNDMQIKVARFEGAFTWHHHEAEDEAFLVLSGTVRIELEDGAVELGPGELLVVPRGVEHRPVAVWPAQVVLFEKAETVSTGSG